MKAGAESIFCSTICMSAVYWLSIMPENMPAPLVKKRRQPGAQGRIGQPIHAAFGEHADHGDGSAQGVDRQTDRGALEIGPGEHHLILGQEDSDCRRCR